MKATSPPTDWLELATPNGAVIRVRKASHPRARRLRLTVTADGARVSYPKGTHSAQVFVFVRGHVEWLSHKLEEMRLDARELPVLKLGRPTEMSLRGQRVRLLWGEGAYPRIEERGHAIRLIVPRPHSRALPIAHGLLASFLEAHMRRDLARWLPRYVTRLGLAPTSVRVRPLKSLWGSLDTRDRINLDLSLALAPPDALRYVLAHELCHLKVRNHSAAFWRRVATLYPAWHEQRDWLRDNGAMLKAQMDRLIADVAD